MSKIYYITRSYLPDETGGTLARAAAVELFREAGLNVVVFTPNYKNNQIEENNSIIRLPYNRSKWIVNPLEMAGLIEDYLDSWVKDSLEYLSNILTKDDCLFANSGGEIGCFKLASLLKQKIGCKYIANYRDPINYTYIDGKINNRWTHKLPHVCMEPIEKKYISNADLIIAYSAGFAQCLKEKFPFKADVVKINYFGYANELEITEKECHDKLRIAYGGDITRKQKPEILAEALMGIDNVEIYYIGNHEKYKKLYKYKNAICLPKMLNTEYNEFMQKNIDIGFVSIAIEYVRIVTTSKLYQYINMGIPILAAACKNGEIDNILSHNGFGICCDYKDVRGLREATIKLSDHAIRNKMRQNLIEKREQWAMKNRIKDVVNWIKEL